METATSACPVCELPVADGDSHVVMARADERLRIHEACLRIISRTGPWPSKASV
jgi:hypothetical protein